KAWELALHGHLSLAQDADLDTARLYSAVLHRKGVVAARQGEELAALGQPGLLPLIGQVRVKRTTLARLYQSPAPTPKGQAAWKEQFQKVEKELVELEEALALRSKPFRRFLQLRGASAADVRTALPARTALVDFLFY